jgi:DNA-binding beta-propeller fold protein YncE
MAISRRVLIVAAVLSFPLVSQASEMAKLRYAQSVYQDNKGVGVSYPEGVAFSEKYGLIVGDTANDRLVRYAFENGALKAGTEIKIPQLSQPVRIQVSSKGDILALDGKQRHIVRLSAEGTFKSYVTAEGAPGGSAVVPRSFKIDRDDNIYVLDIFSARVLLLDPDGKYRKEIAFPKDYGFFSDLAVDPKGTILVIDPVKSILFSAPKNGSAFSPLGGSLKEYLSFPVGLTTDSLGTIYIVDANGADIGIVGQDGSFLGKQLGMGRTDGLLYYPSQMCIRGNGDVFIADRGNSRVQEFTPVK